MQIEQVRTYLLQLQDSICAELAAEDGGGAFISDEWQRAEGGGGRSRVLTEGAVFERAGVNFSHVRGASLPPPPVPRDRSWPAAVSRPWAYPW